MQPVDAGDAVFSMATDINAAGKIVGTIRTPEGSKRAVLPQDGPHDRPGHAGQEGSARLRHQ
jgi:hypothetical protein